MVQLSLPKIAVAVCRNQSKRVGLTAAVKKVRRDRERGGTPWSKRPLEDEVGHILHIFNSLRSAMPELIGKAMMEIGPGDNIGVGYCFLHEGARVVYAIEKYDSVALNDRAIDVLKRLDAHFGKTRISVDKVIKTVNGERQLNEDYIRLRRKLFGEVEGEEPIDVIYSHDVVEHLPDIDSVFVKARELLRDGGMFVNSIDFAGHNVFNDFSRPLDFLTCPEWLWNLMLSHVETTTRVRYSDVLSAAKKANLNILSSEALARTKPEYLARVKPHLMPRYKKLTDDDLSMLQCLLVAQK